MPPQQVFCISDVNNEVPVHGVGLLHSGIDAASVQLLSVSLSGSVDRAWLHISFHFCLFIVHEAAARLGRQKKAKGKDGLKLELFSEERGKAGVL